MGSEPARPVAVRSRVGRWEAGEDGAIALVGSRCLRCGEAFFPERTVCASCRSELQETILLQAPAILRNFTLVYELPPGFTSPAAIGYAEFAPGVLVLAPIDVAFSQLRRGMSLTVHLGTTRQDTDGQPVVTYRFGVGADGKASSDA